MKDMIMEKILQTYLEDNTFILDKDVIIKEYSSEELSFLKWENQSKAEPTKAQVDSISEQLFPSWKANRENEYPSLKEFAEAYCEKEIGEDSTKWNAYKTAYNKVRTDNPKS